MVSTLCTFPMCIFRPLSVLNRHVHWSHLKVFIAAAEAGEDKYLQDGIRFVFGLFDWSYSGLYRLTFGGGAIYTTGLRTSGRDPFQMMFSQIHFCPRISMYVVRLKPYIVFLFLRHVAAISIGCKFEKRTYSFIFLLVTMDFKKNIFF